MLRRRSRIRPWTTFPRPRPQPSSRRGLRPRLSNRRWLWRRPAPSCSSRVRVARFPSIPPARRAWRRCSIGRVNRLECHGRRSARVIITTARGKKIVAIVRVATSGSKSRIDRRCKSSATRIAVRLYDESWSGSDDYARKSLGNARPPSHRRASGLLGVADLLPFGGEL